jgi:hypothetical protein
MRRSSIVALLVLVSGCSQGTLDRSREVPTLPPTTSLVATTTSAAVEVSTAAPEEPLTPAEIAAPLLRDLFSNELDRVERSVDGTADGSAARAYFDYQRRSVEISFGAGDGGFDPATATVEGPRVSVCDDPEDDVTCFVYSEIEVEDGLLVDFAVNGRPIGPRLVRPSSEPVTRSSVSVEILGGYQVYADGTALYVLVSIEATGRAVVDAAKVTYVDPDTDAAVVADILSGPASVGTADEYELVFSRSRPGGTLNVVDDQDPAAPVVISIPVDPFQE